MCIGNRNSNGRGRYDDIVHQGAAGRLRGNNHQPAGAVKNYYLAGAGAVISHFCTGCSLHRG